MNEFQMTLRRWRTWAKKHDKTRSQDVRIELLADPPSDDDVDVAKDDVYRELAKDGDADGSVSLWR